MTTTTEPTTATKITVLKHLVADRGLDWTAQATHLTVDQTRDIAAAHGYPSPDRMKWAIDVLTAQLDNIPTKTKPTTGTVVEAPAEPAVKRTDPKLSVATIRPGDIVKARNQGDLTEPAADRLADLTARAAESPKQATRNLGARLAAIADDLQARLDAEAAKAQEARKAKAEREANAKKIAELKAQLAELQGKKPAKAKSGKSTSRSKAVRQWARDNGYDVAATGKMPADVHVAYDAAHRQEAS